MTNDVWLWGWILFIYYIIISGYKSYSQPNTNPLLRFRRGKTVMILFRFIASFFPVDIIRDGMKFDGYTAGYRLDMRLQNILAILMFTFTVSSKLLEKKLAEAGKTWDYAEKDTFDYGNAYLNWFEYQTNVTWYIAILILFLIFIFIPLKAIIDKVVEWKTKARFITSIEMLWAKRRIKYLYALRARRVSLGHEEYMKAVSVANKKYYSVTGTFTPKHKSMWYPKKWWQRMFDWL